MKEPSLFSFLQFHVLVLPMATQDATALSKTEVNIKKELL